MIGNLPFTCAQVSSRVAAGPREPAEPAVVLAIDAGTTKVRTIAFDAEGRPVGHAARELTQHYPHPGWVEHDATEILAATAATVASVASGLGERPIAAVGITNQRETTVVWDRATGQPTGPAIVWQDRRTAPVTADLRAAGHEPFVRARTGLLLDPYFSATKLAWILRQHDGPARSLAFGTVDC